MAETVKWFKKINTTQWIAIASVLAIIAGISIGPAIKPIQFVGDIFLRLITMLVPLMILGVVTQAVGQLDLKMVGKLGFKLFSWFLILTIIAAIIGISIGFLIQPGVGLPSMELKTAVKPTTQTLPEILLNLFSSNIVQSLANGATIQIIIFALFLGAAVSTYTQKTGDKTMIDLIVKINTLILSILKNVMKYVAPIGCFALLAVASGTLGVSVFQLMIKYLGSLILACSIFMVFHILLTSAWCKVNPLKVAAKLSKMTVVAMITTSSAVTLPTKIEDSIEKFGISRRISNLAGPLGMVFNSAGQAIFMAIASIMFSQFFHLDLPLSRLVEIIAIAVLACLGNAAVPGGGLVVLVSMMPILGLPIEAIALVAGVDWFRGAITTVPNVDGDVLVAMCIAKDVGELDMDIFDGKKKAPALSDTASA